MNFLFQTLLLFLVLQWIVVYKSGKSITCNNKYNEYNYNNYKVKVYSVSYCYKDKIKLLNYFFITIMIIRINK